MNKAGRDPDNLKKLTQDSITMSDVVWEDDTYCLPRTNRVYIDKDNPRIELIITQVKFIGVFDNKRMMNDFISKCKTCNRYRKGSCGILKDSLDNKITKEVNKINNNFECNKYKEKK